MRIVFLSAAVILAGCGDGNPEKSPNIPPQPPEEEPSCIAECVSDPADDVNFLSDLGCLADFDLIASYPLDASIPGARSVKTVIDRTDADALYFMNSQKYLIHHEFASANLSIQQGMQLVPSLQEFSEKMYSSPDRRFVLGSITHYEGPDIWAYEVAPYDTADAEMIETAFDNIREHGWFCNELFFHPTSTNVEVVVPDLPGDIPIVTTDELFEGVDYQPLNYEESTGYLQFHTADQVNGTYTWYREIVVLDAVPNDISIVAGIITEEFQTPLSHINVLSQNRGTPNMALRGAFNDPELRALEGQWVRMLVAQDDYIVEPISAEDAEAWWQEHKPPPLDIGEMDLSVQTLVDDVDVTGPTDPGERAAVITSNIPAFGGKATHFGAMSHIGPDVPMPKGFVAPLYFYNEFMEYNGFWAHYDDILAQDYNFVTDPAYRQVKLEEFQQMILSAPLQPGFAQLVTDKCNNDFPGTPMRFRSSTNAEDLGDFTGAGLYTSQTGDPTDPDRTIADAIRTVYASVWGPRAFEEREYYGIDHRKVGMALLSHRSFPDEEANGVAITGNIFDQTGLQPAFFVNAQAGGESVVLPDPGVSTDQFIYYFLQIGSPISFTGHSNLIPHDETVLTVGQTHELGIALNAIHLYFSPVYSQDDPFFYAMDTEFKFDDDGGGEWNLYMKQARKFPSWRIE